MAQMTTVGRYLVHRLEEVGLEHVFGIPGDYVLGLYDLLEASSMKVIGTCSEAGAAFAADAYARVNGLGAICVTYCVGGLNTLNAVAGAYAEKSPLVVISGSPGMGERVRSPLLHHRVRDFNTQSSIFEQVTAATAVLADPEHAPEQIDHALAACLRTKRPVYIELPRDLCNKACRAPGPLEQPRPVSDRQSLREALGEARDMLRRARRPIILAGVEIHRYALQDELLRLVEKSGYPVAAMLLGKSVISERHPQYLGIYEGAMGREDVRKAVEASDCLLVLGAFMTDIDLGIFTARLDPGRTIHATSERISIKHHHFDGVELGDFVKALIDQAPRRPHKPARSMKKATAPYRPKPSHAITVRRFFQRMNTFLEDDFCVISDIGDSLFGAADLVIHRKTEFISPAYYTSMGFGLPAALGAQIRNRKLRPIVFVGDGAFQMTGMELSTIARHHLNPLVFVLNNKGYTTERFIQEGPYNDIHEWAYHLVPQVLREGQGFEVRTEGDLECALAQARRNLDSFSIINVHLDRYDKSDALVRLGKRLARRLKD